MTFQLLHARYQVIKVFCADTVEEMFLGIDKHQKDSELYLIKKIGNIPPIHPTSHSNYLQKVLDFLKGQQELINQVQRKYENVHKIFDFLVENQQFFVVQEYIQGNSLTEEISTKILNEIQIIELLLEISQNLRKIHQQGLIHGNLKPNNIIRRESDQQLVFVDFTNINDAVVHRAKNIEYIPMEQLHGNPHPGSDIYALGLIIISAVTGLPASQVAGENSPRHLFTGEIVWRKYNSQVSSKLAKIINKMVHLDYRQRYKNVENIINDLEKIIHPSPPQRILWNRLNPWKLLLITVLISATITGGYFYFTTPTYNIQKSQTFANQGLDSYQQANYKRAITALNQAIKYNPESSIAYNLLGDAYYRLGNYHKSQINASEAIRLNPQDANALYDRGFALYKLGNFNGAIADFNQAIQLEADNPNYYYGRGLARSKIREIQGAITDFSQAITLNFQLEAAYLERGKIYRKQGLYLQAIVDFNQVISLNTENFHAYYERGFSQYQIRELKAAIKDVNMVLELEPNLVSAYILRGSIYSDLNENEKALDDFNNALQREPKSNKAYRQRGKFYLDKGQIELATQDLNKAISLASKDAIAYNFRGNIKQEQGKFKAALQDYQRAIRINPEYAKAYYNRGLANMTLGYIPKAIADFEKAAALFQEQGEKQDYQDAIAKLKSLKPN